MKKYLFIIMILFLLFQIILFADSTPQLPYFISIEMYLDNEKINGNITTINLRTNEVISEFTTDGFGLIGLERYLGGDIISLKVCYNNLCKYDNITIIKTQDFSEKRFDFYSQKQIIYNSQFTIDRESPEIYLDYPKNNSVLTQDNLIFGYRVYDENNIQSCYLSINNVIKSINENVIKNITQTFHLSFVDLEDSYGWFVSCSDGIFNNISEMRYFKIKEDKTYQIVNIIINPIKKVYQIFISFSIIIKIPIILLSLSIISIPINLISVNLFGIELNIFNIIIKLFKKKN